MKQDLKIILTILFLSAIVLVLIFALTKPPTTVLPEDLVKSVLYREDSYTQGSKDSKVKLVEFADMQCPGCASVHPFLTELLKKYPSQIQYTFKHYPLQQHKNAQLAAQAAEAAGLQGQFAQYQDSLFSKQRDWESKTDPRPFFLTLATTLKFDLKKFESDMSSKKILEKINRDIADGNTININSTPTIYINDKKYEGNLSLQSLEQAVEAMLK